MSRPSIRGLYVVTPSTGDIIAKTKAALDGGARVVQFRDKSDDKPKRLATALQLRALCQQRNAVFIVNDDIELAMTVNADGVHIGKGDGGIQKARELFADGIIGVSCYNELDRAIDAQRQGADYVAFGRFFPSRTKPEAVQASLDLIERAKAQLQIPVVAIGGINANNAFDVINAGADAVAVIDAIFSSSDVAQAARAIARQFDLEKC